MEGWSEEYKILGHVDRPIQRSDEEIVLLSQVISHTCNIGYEMQRNAWLLSFNGRPVNNLLHLNDMIHSAFKNMDKSRESEDFPLVFEFSGGNVIVLDGHAALAAQDEICKEHSISSPCSTDLKALKTDRFWR